jgi:hypothetical protein
LYNVVHKKAAEWAVLDSDPRVSGGTYVANAMVATGGKEGVCRFFAKGSCKRGKDCKFLHDKPSKTPAEGGGKGKGKRATKGTFKKDKCFNCGRVTNPPHRAATCPEPKRGLGAAAPGASSAGAAQPKAKGAPASPAAPPGLKPDKLQELAEAYLAELAAGSSSSDLLRRLACPAVLTTVLQGEDGVLMVGDSGAELHVVGKTAEAT